MHKIKNLFVVMVGLFVVLLVFGNVSINPKTNIAVLNSNSNLVFIDSDVPYSFFLESGGSGVQQTQQEQSKDVGKSILGLVVGIVIVMAGAKAMQSKKSKPSFGNTDKKGGDTSGEQEWWNI